MRLIPAVLPFALILLCLAGIGAADVSIDLSDARTTLMGGDEIRIEGIRAEGAYWTATFKWNAETASFDLKDYHRSSAPPSCTEEEICGNGIDDDCNGKVDEGCGEICGGIIGLPCPDGEFCLFPVDTCNYADLQGVCTPVPDACPSDWSPVCGCDGKTYSNECTLYMAGQSKAYDGVCSSGK